MTQNWYTVDKGPHMAGHSLPSGRRQFGEVLLWHQIAWFLTQVAPLTNC